MDHKKQDEKKQEEGFEINELDLEKVAGGFLEGGCAACGGGCSTSCVGCKAAV